MSSNLAPQGKRSVALGAIIGAANLNGVPGSQLYRTFFFPSFIYIIISILKFIIIDIPFTFN